MTTAALQQATSVIADTVVAAAFTMAGVPGGSFDATPTSTIVSGFDMRGVGAPVWITEYRQILGVALSAPGAVTTALVGETIVTVVTPVTLNAPSVGTLNFFTAVGSGIKPASLNIAGVGATSFKTDSTYPIPIIPPKPQKVRYISGPEAGVIPVEVVSHSGPDVIEVVLDTSENNYTPIFVDPTNPFRKKIHFDTGS